MGHWYPFAILCVLVNVIFLLMQPFLDESPRWLITKNRYEEAASIINKIRNLSKSFSMKPYTNIRTYRAVITAKKSSSM